jgi:Ca2+-transporting ATPase
MFHPDNFHNLTLEGVPVSLSIQKFWIIMGGPDKIARALRTNLKGGIDGTPQDIDDRIEKFGSNTKRIPRIKGVFEIVIECLSDKILIILLIAATISMILGIITEGPSKGWIDGASIYFAVIAIVSITTANNYVKEK